VTMFDSGFESVFESGIFHWINIIGYIAGVVSIWAMYRKTMIPLRLGTICSNIGLRIFGLLSESYPTVFMHAILLPLNTVRLFQMIQLIDDMKKASGTAQNAMAPLLPYMTLEKMKSGTTLFSKGDVSDKIHFIHSGTVSLEEFDVEHTTGAVFGEIAVFSSENSRTCTAVCMDDCESYTLDTDTMLQHYYQNPNFGMYLVRLMVDRLMQNWKEADGRANALT
jgi:CRP/FNR family cyclic AMP-dependent transcriptional regulator